MSEIDEMRRAAEGTGAEAIVVTYDGAPALSLAYAGAQPTDLFERLAASGVAGHVVALGLVGSGQSGTAVTDDTLRGLAECEALSAVRQIGIRGSTFRGDASPVGDDALRALAASPHASRVTSLWVEDITPASREALIEFLGAWPALTWLKLVRLGLRGDELDALLTHSPCPGLATLEIAACPIGDQGAVHLALADWALTGLHLPHASVEAAGVEALAGSERLEGLAALDLRACPIGDRGAAAIASSNWPLTELTLAECRIYDAGFKALAEAPFLSGLTAFDISGNAPWPTGRDALANSALPQRMGDDVRYEYEDV